MLALTLPTSAKPRLCTAAGVTQPRDLTDDRQTSPMFLDPRFPSSWRSAPQADLAARPRRCRTPPPTFQKGQSRIPDSACGDSSGRVLRRAACAGRRRQSCSLSKGPSLSVVLGSPTNRGLVVALEQTATSLPIRYVFGDRDQGVRLGEDDVLPTTLDDAALFPGAEKPADRKQGGSRHLGDILP